MTTKPSIPFQEHDLLVLQEDLETKLVPVMKNGQVVKENGEVKMETVPKYRKGKKFSVIKMNMFWLSEEEKGGLGIDLGPMDYLRLTYPDRTPTKYFALFQKDTAGDES